MEDKYYSEFISEEFYEKISALRIAKGIKCFEQFAFVFVNSNECKCKNVKENDLKTTKIDDDILANITNIIVLGYGHWKNLGYTNALYNFIGIFDTEGNESTINLGSIALNSIEISTNNYFQIVVISSCNITILHNQFYEYFNRVISPIYKMVSSSLDECNGHRYTSKNLLNIDINPFTSVDLPVWNFQRTLDALKNFEQKLNKKLKDTKFDPEITLKPETILKIKSSEIQF